MIRIPINVRWYLLCEKWPEFELTEFLALIARFMGPTWGPSGDRQDPGGPHVGHMNFAIWVGYL